jgi:hypothetical protein
MVASDGPATVYTVGDFVRRVVESLLGGERRSLRLCARCLVKLTRDHLDKSYSKTAIIGSVDEIFAEPGALRALVGVRRLRSEKDPVPRNADRDSVDRGSRLTREALRAGRPHLGVEETRAERARRPVDVDVQTVLLATANEEPPASARRAAPPQGDGDRVGHHAAEGRLRGHRIHPGLLRGKTARALRARSMRDSRNALTC